MDFVSLAVRLFAASILALLLTISPAEAKKRIALTFDDVPRHQGAFFTPDERSKMLLAGLKKAKVKQVAFFLNPAKLSDPQGQGGEARIAAYVKAGHVIANHSATHLRLNEVTTDAYLADIDQAAAWLKGRNGYRPWFRFPYLDEGRDDKAKRDAVRAGLDARGLRNGYVTVDGADWYLDILANDAKKNGKRMDMDALRDLFVQSHLEAANFNDQLAIKTQGRAPAHVMLLHETDIGAMFIGDLVKALRTDGWTIITADEAYRDPISKERPDVPSAQGTLTEALAWQKGLPAPRWPEAVNTLRTDIAFQDKVRGTLRRQGGMCVGSNIWIPLEEGDRMFRQRGVDVSILGIEKLDRTRIITTSGGAGIAVEPSDDDAIVLASGEVGDMDHKKYLQQPIILEKDGVEIRRVAGQTYSVPFDIVFRTKRYFGDTQISGDYFASNEKAVGMLSRMKFGTAAEAICKAD